MRFQLIVDIPQLETGVNSSNPQDVAFSWQKFEREAIDIVLPSQGSKKLSRNVWLLDAEKSFASLLAFADLAATHQLTYSIFLIEGEFTQITMPPSKPARVLPFQA